MALGFYSGKDAYVDTVPCVQSWQVTEGVSAQRYSASCTPGATNVAPGITNWTGQMTGIAEHPAIVLAALMSGTFDFSGTMNADAGEGDLLQLNGTAVFESVTIDINKENAGPISWQASFGFNGVPTTATASDSDSTLASVAYGDALDVRIGSSPATIASSSVCIRTAQIVFRRPLTTFIRSGTTYRKAGNLEIDINFALYTPDLFLSTYAQGTLAKTHIYTTSAHYWSLNKIRYLGKSNLMVDRQSTNILGYTVNGQWNSHDAGVKGWASFYDGATYTNYYGTAS